MFIIDIEASGLAEESYPIEVGFCSLDQSQLDAFLINPITAENWHYWDASAEELSHGISRNSLSQGVSVYEATIRLNLEKLGAKQCLARVEYPGQRGYYRFCCNT